jgi:formylglycine-generating enzyme required for sulfatase activity/tRNA A-37 threonylcarbamoyl transferase component Bud32
VKLSPRQVLRSALELRILEPEDLRAAGHPEKEPDALLRDPSIAAWLERPVVDALTRWIELTGEDAPTPRTSTTLRRHPRAPASSPDPVEQPAGLRVPDATFAPEQAEEQPPGLGKGDHETFAPERRSAEPEDPGAGDPVANHSLPAAQDPAPAIAEPSSTEDGRLLAFESLPPADRRAITNAAFRRGAVSAGRVTREQAADAGHEPGTGLAEALVSRGALSADGAREIEAVARTLRDVCASCLEVLPEGRPPSERCPFCGRPWRPPRSTSRGATVIGAVETVQGVEGFPGARARFGGYELLERVAEGGMGVVFKARQTSLNRTVALKVMRGGGLASESRRRRFLLEAEAAAGLDHPGIVSVHEIGEVAGYPFYTMDFVDGLFLDDYAAREGLSPREVCALVRSVASAVQYFHLHGIIHRDLKPENILVDQRGVPKIIDFGIARRLEGTWHTTVEGDVLGTLHYVSPEQAAGRVREVDTRSDIYALGAILYELLTGAPPWDGLEQAALLLAIQREDPPSVQAKNPTVPADLEAIVGKAMAKKRERRYQSAAELALDLDRFERGLPIMARPATLLYRARRAARRHLPLTVAVGVALSLLLVLGVVHALSVAARRRAVAALLAAAEDVARSAAEREASLQRVLFLDPGNVVAQGRLDVLFEKRRRVETELARERAQREANAIKERDRARLEAEQRALSDATERARALLEEAAAEGNDLRAIRLLGEALDVVPKGERELRSRIEERRIELDLRQVRLALDAGQAGLAEFWLEDAQRLSSTPPQRAKVDALATEVAGLAHGQRDLEQARAFMASGDWIAARTKLEQARAQGLGSADLEKDRALVAQRCLERALTLLEEGRARLSHGDAPGGLAAAEEALRFEPGLAGVQEVIAGCEARIAHDARRDAAELSLRPDGRARALEVLAEASRLVTAPELVASLQRELAARARLADPQLSGLVFVPDVPELSVAAFYMERTAVTNREFEAFTAAKGYEQPELWDPEARPLLPSFRSGPRGWSDGGYGGPANAERPVRGVTVHEARAFARWRSRTTGRRWRLPTEREWEVAAGWDPATSRLRTYPWGETFHASALVLDARVPARVGAMKEDTSPLGLVDASGNVRQWVERPGLEPGVHGADFASDEPGARYYARVQTIATPGPTPSTEVVKRIGFRLVREIEGEQ